MNIIGIDLGGTKILGIRADENGNVLDQVRRPTDASQGPEAVIDRIAETIRELGRADAIGIGTPGPVNPWEGVVYNPPNLPGWQKVELRRMLRERLDVPEQTPISLINDANAAALAEYKFGAAQKAGKQITDLVYLTISTGVGGGVISDGKLLVGPKGMGAEMGHMLINPGGPRCNWGDEGCLEAMASGTGLAREAAAILGSGRPTSIRDAVGGDPKKVTAEVVVKAAREGDPLACELMEQEAEWVGIGVVSFIYIFNPQLVVLGGGVTNAGDLLFKPARDTVSSRVMHAYLGSYEIVPAALGDNSGALGAVAAGLEELEA